MARIEKTIEIKAPPEKLWPMGSIERIPEWMSFIKKVEWTSKDKDVVGSTARVSVELAGVKSESNVEMTECVKNKKRAWRAISGSPTPVSNVTALTPTEAGTKITYLMDYELPYSFLGKIIDKLRVSKELEKSIEQGFKKLKATVEK